MKDPDGVHESIRDAVEESLPDDLLDGDEREALFETRVDKTERLLSKWIECGEYLSVEFDLDEGTARVLTEDE